MAKHERVAFLKFFSGYFISVALLILVVGYLYYSQMQRQFIQREHFSLIEYARHIKNSEPLDSFVDFYSLRVPKESISMDNLLETRDEFIKTIPMEDSGGTYLRVFKSKKHYLQSLDELALRVKSTQVALLALFALLSYILAKSAIKPMQESIEALDSFSKDLLHDLNTPLTSMKLNIKLLQKRGYDDVLITKLKRDLDSIVELEENLTILLDKKSFVFEDVSVCLLLKELLALHRDAHKEVEFFLECRSFTKHTNQKALKEILNNLLANATKHGGGVVKIYTKDSTLFMYNNISSEIASGRKRGLNIVKQLCKALDIEFDYSFEDGVAIVSLGFR